jgi:hypothetical protein
VLINHEFERVPRDSQGCFAVAQRWDRQLAKVLWDFTYFCWNLTRVGG